MEMGTEFETPIYSFHQCSVLEVYAYLMSQSEFSFAGCVLVPR